MERRGAEASGKIDEAVKVLDESDDEVVDFDDPSLVRHVDDLRRTSVRMKSITNAPVPIDGDDTPVEPPNPTGRAGTARPLGRLVRPPRRPPTQ
jgi:hypothetical protein